MIRRLIREEDGFASMLWFSMFAIFLMIPITLVMVYFAQMMYARGILSDYTDQALVGAITDVQKVDYTSAQGDDLWYYAINTTGGTTQADGSILLDSSSSPVWSFANQTISDDLNNYSYVKLAQPISITVTKAGFNQKVNVYSGGAVTSTYDTSNDDYVDAQIQAVFTIPATFPVNVMESLYGGTVGSSETINVSFSPSATVEEPTLSVNQ